MPKLNPRAQFTTDDPKTLREELVAFRQEVVEALGALGKGRLRAATSDTVFADYNDTVRLDPGSAGQGLVLPPPRKDRAGARVTAMVVSDDGSITVETVDGTIDGEDTVTLPARVGLLHFTLDGALGWYSSGRVLADVSGSIDAAFGSTRGAILYRGASGWAILAPGTDALPLVANGAGADPAYERLANSGFRQSAGSRLVGNPTGSTADVTDIPLATGGHLAFESSELRFRKSRSQHYSYEDFDTVRLDGGGSTISAGSTVGVLCANSCWTAAATGSSSGGVADIDAEDGHPGIIRISTGSVDGDQIHLYMGGSDARESFIAQNIQRWEVIARIGSVEEVIYQIGLRNAVAGSTTDFVLFQYIKSITGSATTWTCNTREAGSTSNNSTSSTADTDWHSYAIEADHSTGLYTFYIDDVSIASETINTPSTQGLKPTILIQTETNAVKTLDIDLSMLESTTLARF